MNRRVSVHDAEGQTLLVLGGEGHGPGEFEYPTRLFLARPDTIKVFDAGLLRVTSFSSSGAVVATVSPPAEPAFGQGKDLRFVPGGELYKLSYEGYQESLMSALDGVVKGVVRGRNAIAKWTPPSRDWQILADVPGLQVYVDLGQGVLEDVPFAERPLWSLAREGFWHADNSRYELTRYTGEGAVVCRIRVAWDRVRTSNEEREEYYAAEDLAGDTRFSEDRLTRIREDRKDIPFPDHKPAIRAFLVAQNGDLWINPIGGSSATAELSWHVLAPTGRPRGVANLPARFRPFFILGDLIFGRELGELDVHQLAVYRLTSAE